MLDDRTPAPDPHIAPYLVWSYDDSRTAWPALLGDSAGGPDVPPTAAPARLKDATGLPAANIDVGQLDVFRDEDTAYATKHSRAGVPVEFHLHPGAPARVRLHRLHLRRRPARHRRPRPGPEAALNRDRPLTARRIPEKVNLTAAATCTGETSTDVRRTGIGERIALRS